MIARAQDSQKTVDFFLTFANAGKTWLEYIRRPAYDGTGDINEHVSLLVTELEANLAAGNNTFISNVRSGELPEKPIRATYFEQLMVSVLCSNQSGVSAVYAESGTGKSVGVTLAVTTVASVQKSDLFVVLQGGFKLQLRGIFRISDEEFTDAIAPSLFSSLRNKDIRLHLVFDNVLDSGVRDDSSKGRLKALARAAAEHQYQVVFTMHDTEAAESVATLNGDTTFTAELQDECPGAYRWTRNETVQLIQGFLNGQDTEDTKKEILKDSEIPDEIGGWRPRATKFFIRTGQKPKQTPKQAGWAAELLKCQESFVLAR